ncbi:hypothetical protein EPI10_024985 [Gossypium australe]|uniref:Uncharacterized protein n=1 Tax=Gossypium australe TaxID=47621 RepID=A0A5B6W0S8_9ROSI|nr:hypothetical protein EPI10_024985 [Gossypium australe]
MCFQVERFKARLIDQRFTNKRVLIFMKLFLWLPNKSRCVLLLHLLRNMTGHCFKWTFTMHFCKGICKKKSTCCFLLVFTLKGET